MFNGQEFLPELLDSLLAQTFRDFEILICDNASSDRTAQICREYERHDSRIRYICNERNLGAVANFNRVFELSTAPLFKWAAHDDLYHAAYLTRALGCSTNPTSSQPTRVLPLSTKRRSLPLSRRQSFIDPRLKAVLGDVRASAIPCCHQVDFGGAHARFAWAPTCLVWSVVKSCSKRSPAQFRRRSRDAGGAGLLGVSDVQMSNCF